MENENLNVMFFHGKTTDDYKFTIAGIIEDSNLIMGIAMCNSNDQFIKSKGRLIAEGRLLSQKDRDNIGKVCLNLYTEAKNSLSLEKDYFMGHEFQVFTEHAAGYNDFTKKRLLKEFNLRKITPAKPPKNEDFLTILIKLFLGYIRNE